MQLLTHSAPLLRDYDALICDVWGVLHNGAVAFPSAIAALQAYRAHGGKVVLVSNAPRPAQSIWKFLETLHIPHDIADDFITSGDLTLEWLQENPKLPIHWIGAQRDTPLFEGLAPNFVDIHAAQAILCTGLHDDTVQTAEDFRDVLTIAASRKLPFMCANPDLMVERGDHQVYCAGAVAQLYEVLGGNVDYFGKPYRPVYEAAHARINAIAGRSIEKSKILGIGDALRTDIAGAQNYGVDALMIAGGLHAKEFAGIEVVPASPLLTPYAHTIKGIMWTFG